MTTSGGCGTTWSMEITDMAAGQTWIEWNSGTRHVIKKVTGSFVFHVREGAEKVERTRIVRFKAACHREDR